MNRYDKGQIYKIVDVGYNKCYIGSTCEKLSQRMARHRDSYNAYLRGTCKKLKSFDLFDEYGIDNCKIEWIEDYPCNSKKELEAREGYYQKNIECVNRVLLGRTPKEYKQYYNPLNQDKIKKGLKEWYERTKEDRKDKLQEYRDSRKEETREYNKEYREKKGDELKEKKREQYQKTKEERSKKVECNVCGKIIRSDALKKHQQTKKCQASSIKSNS